MVVSGFSRILRGCVSWFVRWLTGIVLFTDDAGAFRVELFADGVLKRVGPGEPPSKQALIITVVLRLISLAIAFGLLFWLWTRVSSGGGIFWPGFLVLFWGPIALRVPRARWPTVVAFGRCGSCGIRFHSEPDAASGRLIRCSSCGAHWHRDRHAATHPDLTVPNLSAIQLKHTRFDARGVIVTLIATPGSACYRMPFVDDENLVRSIMLEDRLALRFRELPTRLFEASSLIPSLDRRYRAVKDAALALGCCPCCAATIGDRDAGFDGNVLCPRCATSWPGEQLARPALIEGLYLERLEELRRRRPPEPVYPPCRKCGYDTTGTKGFCPECGLLPVGEALDPARVQPRGEAAAIGAFAFKPPLCARCRRELPGVDRSCEACGYVTGTVYA